MVAWNIDRIQCLKHSLSADEFSTSNPSGWHPQSLYALLVMGEAQTERYVRPFVQTFLIQSIDTSTSRMGEEKGWSQLPRECQLAGCWCYRTGAIMIPKRRHKSKGDQTRLKLDYRQIPHVFIKFEECLSVSRSHHQRASWKRENRELGVQRKEIPPRTYS